MGAIEPKVREFCARTLDPLVGAGGFDFIADLGAQMPMRTIGMLLGIPEATRRRSATRSTPASASRTVRCPTSTTCTNASEASAQIFADYIDWRAEQPLRRPHDRAAAGRVRGRRRRAAAALTREEVLNYVSLLAAAGNETTTRLIGWTGKVLAEHPDQRREIAEDRSLVPDAIEEILRFEAPSPVQARYVDRATSSTTARPCRRAAPCCCSTARPTATTASSPTATRSTSTARSTTTCRFGYGIHFCLGAALGPPRGPGRPRRGAAALPRRGRSTGTTPSRPAPRPSGAGNASRSSPA